MGSNNRLGVEIEITAVVQVGRMARISYDGHEDRLIPIKNLSDKARRMMK